MAQEIHTFTGDEVVSQHTVKEHNVIIYGCFGKGTPIGKYDFYDIYIEISGGTFCMNEDYPVLKKPTIKDLESLTQEYLESLD